MILIIVGMVLSFASSAYILVLLARVALDWARILAPRWKPEGFLLVLANVVYMLSDPPVNWLRRFIPPLRLGSIALDVGFIVLFIAVGMIGRLGTFLVNLGYSMP